MLEQLRQEIETLPPEAQTLLFQFIQVLKNNDALNFNTTNLPKNKPITHLMPRKKGSAKGKLIIHHEDDEHLEFFREYMPQ